MLVLLHLGRQQRSCCKISKKTGTSAQEKNVSSQNERSISHSQETLQTCSCNVSLPRKQKWDDCLARRTKQILQGAWKHQQKDSLSKSGVDKFSQLRLSKTLFKEPADNAWRRARFTKIQSQFTLSSKLRICAGIEVRVAVPMRRPGYCDLVAEIRT